MPAERLPDGLRSTLERALGGTLTAARRVGGGDINDAWAVEVGGRAAFVKAREDAEPDAFTVEAEGLRWLAEAGALRIPEVLAVSEDPPLLVLELGVSAEVLVAEGVRSVRLLTDSPATATALERHGVPVTATTPISGRRSAARRWATPGAAASSSA